MNPKNNIDNEPNSKDIIEQQILEIGKLNDKISELEKFKTESKRTEKAQKELLNVIGRVAKVGGWELDLVSNNINFSKEALFINDLGQDEDISLEQAFEMIHPEDRAAHQAVVERALIDGKSWDSELRMKTATGRDIWVRSQAIVEIKNGKAIRLHGVFQDITERKQAEEDLKEAQRIGKLGFWDMNLETNELTWSDESFVIYGFEPQQFVPTFENFVEIVHPEDLERVQQNVDTVLRGESVYDIDFRFVLPNKEIGWIHCEGEVTRNSKGDAIRFFGIQIDITERKHEELKLQKSESDFRELVEKSNIAILIDDIDGNFKYFNEIFTKLFGYSAEEIKKKSIQTLVHPDDLDRVIKFHKKHLQGKKISSRYEFRGVRKDGSTIYLEVDVVNLEEGNGTRSYLWDITERKHANEALKESEERWHFALEGSREGVWDWNVVANKVFFSKRWKEMLGYGENEIKNDFKEWDKRVHPKDKEQCNADLNKHLSGKTDFYENEHRILCKDGSYKWILDRGKVVSWTENKKPLRVIGTHTDISERKLMEKSLLMKDYAVASSINAIAITDMDGVTVYVNDATVKMWGCKNEDELIGHNLIDFWGGDGIYQTIEALEKKGFKIGEDIGKKIDGTVFPVQFSASVVKDYDGNPKYMFGSFVDITERKQAEEKLKESEEKFRTLVSNITGVTYRCDCEANWTMLYLSNQIEDLSGFPATDFIDNSVRAYASIIYPDDRKMVEDAVFGSVGKNKPFTLEYRIIHADGSIRWISEDGQGILDDKNNVSFLDGVLFDITDRKQAEEELKKHRDHLEELVKERTEELENNNTELQRFHDATIEREFRMKEMSVEIEKLKSQLKK